MSRSAERGTAVIFVLLLSGAVLAEQLAPGVTYTLYNVSGPNKVHVVAIDRNYHEYTLDVGWPQKKRNYTAHSRTSQTFALYDNPPTYDVIAATNGSYFASAPVIIGTSAANGEMLEPPSGVNDTFMLGPSGIPAIRSDITQVNGALFFADNSSIPLEGYNIPNPPVHKITAYTPQWDTSTRSNFISPSLVAEVVLENVTYAMRGHKEVSGIVTAIHTPTSGNADIPAGGMVLTCYGIPKSTVVAKTQIGDRLRMRFETSVEEYNLANMAITGIGWIIHNGLPQNGTNGQPNNWANRSAGTPTSRNPRTVLGWSNTHLYMIVCDGRTTASVGMTWLEMTNFLTGTLNALDAINLDGGGSSTMVTNGAVRNTVSDGSERFVANTVMLVKKAPALSYPFSDPFGLSGRLTGWDDKFTYSPVVPFAPASPSGDGYVLRVGNTTDGAEVVRHGNRGDADYSVQAYVYCAYRPDVAGDGYERYVLLARDSGAGALGRNSYGGGSNAYALLYDSNTGRVQAGKYVNGTFTDLLPAPVYLASTAWRQFRIDCYGTTITYSIDGNVLGNIDDAAHARGFFGIGHQEFFATDSNATFTRADHLTAFVDTGSQPPVAEFSANPLSGIKPLQVQFTDLSTGGSATSWAWNFGDSSTSTARNPLHTYQSSGDFSVSLTVTGPGGSDSQTKAAYIHVQDPSNKPGDYDGDGDVDLDDFAHFQYCLSGQGNEQSDPNCHDARFDLDTDVDGNDRSYFLGCLSGADIPSDPQCLTNP